jgi:hypothetical protein
MAARAGLQIVLVLALTAAIAHAGDAPGPDDADDEASAAAYKRAQIALYDTLRSDSSPDRQVLAGRLYVDDDHVPAALRPKQADVVARAAQLAPDDAFVQWMAADQGSYYSSQCGPTRWPEAEVANLVRLEPDNAGALQFAVALAQAKGDQAALDDALVRMASAKRADDHLGDEIAAWSKTYVAHPDALTSGNDANTSADDKAFLRALQQTGFRSAPTESALEAACKPDAASEHAWQRLGWCADAGLLLATHGNSFTLRDLGLKMLTAAGAQRDDLADLQRQIDWLKANAATPMQNTDAFGDASSDRAADWHGAASEIFATERRLKRTGKPLTPPSGWVKADDDAAGENGIDAKAARQTYQDYLKVLLDDMHGSSDVRERALALASTRIVDAIGGSTSASGEQAAAPENADTDPLVSLAASNPDNLLVQWVTAIAAKESASGANMAAIANAQRLDADNAAAWALSLSPTGKGDPMAALRHMAASTRYDEHTAEMAGVWLGAVLRHPVPPELADSVRALSPVENLTANTAGKGVAMTMAYANSIGASTFIVNPTCTASATIADKNPRKDACTAIGRLMLHSGRTLLVTISAEQMLRELDVFDVRDRERAHLLGWWREMLQKTMTKSDEFDAYVNDYLASGSEIEAMRLAAARIGKAEPPADWKSPFEKLAAKKKQ